MLIGYARLSTDDENLVSQLEVLRAAGCGVILEDTGPGLEDSRKALADALSRCAAGDVLVVWKLSRLAGSLAGLIGVAEDLRDRGAGLKVLTGAGAAAIDRMGPDFPDILAAIAECERERRSEWTQRGMKAAARRGRRYGPPPKLTPQDIVRARQWIEAGRLRTDVADALGVCTNTLQWALERSAVSISGEIS